MLLKFLTGEKSMFHKRSLCVAALASMVSVGIVPSSISIIGSGAEARVLQDSDEERRRKRQTLSTSTARVLGEVFNEINLDPPNYPKALDQLNKLLARDSLSGFDRSTALELRGGVYAGLENYAASLRDYVQVLEIDSLPNERLKQIRFNVAQLYFVEENYAQAIRFMRQYLEAEGGDVADANAWYILAAAYVSQDDYARARRPAENVIRYDDKKAKKNYDLLNLIYSQLNLNTERGRLLEQMIELFPQEESYWAQLSGAYSQAGRDADAFSTLEVAYKAGLLVDEDKIVALAQYYSALNNPYRGAKLIEAEMATGTVKRNLRNLELLAQLWTTSRDQPKAIAALTAAAQISPSGELYYRLGQSYVANEQYSQAVENLRQAQSRGGLRERDRADIQLLLGSALFSMDSDSFQGRRNACREFRRATNFSTTRREAQGWVQYIQAIEDTLWNQDEVERVQALGAARQELERCESIVDVFELGGNVDRERLAQCRVLIEAGVEDTQPAPKLNPCAG